MPNRQLLDNDSDEEVGIADRIKMHRSCLIKSSLCFTAISIIGALVVIIILVPKPHYMFKAPPPLQPTWEVTGITIDNFDFPPLMMRDIEAADTSNCPAADPCGVATAKYCSKCPRPGMWNAGCICKGGNGGTPAPPGSVIQSNTSACPWYDHCGGSGAKGCSTCPDASWINEGCTCRQPLSAEQFFHGLGGVVGLLFGSSSSVIKIRLRAQAEVQNPAPIPATTENGVLSVRYRGTLIGSAALKPINIGPKSSATITADVLVDKVSQVVGMEMLQELINNKNQINIVVEGSVAAKAASLFTVQCKTICHLRTDVSTMPKPKFTKKDCSYTYIS